MAFLHSHSSECMSSELDLFTLPATQTSIESSSYLHYKPVSSITDDGDAPLEFVVPGASEFYVDLAHTMLYIKARITPVDNDTENEKVGPINNFLHSMFNQVDVFFNQKLVSPPNNAYPYRAYIESLLNYSPEAKESHLTTNLWYNDEDSAFDAPANAASPQPVNTGLVKRKHFTLGGRIFDMVGHLHCDVFNQDKMLLNGVEMRVRLVRSKDAFCLMDASEDGIFKVSIKEATLIVRRVKVSPGIMLAHANALSKTTAKYPITRVEVKSFTLHAGITGDSIDNVILGQLPKRIIIGFVDNRAFNGNRSLNPFNFQHFSLNYLSLNIDGMQVPSKPLQPRFTGRSQEIIEAFHTLFTGTGIHFLNEGNGINRYNYGKGYFLTAFDLTHDMSAHCATHWNIVRSGSIRIEVGFEQALTQTINCIVYVEYDNVLEIDASRQIISDFNA